MTAAPDEDLLDELRDLALRVTGAAGELLRDPRPELVTVAGTKSSPTDVVTAMDRASEALLVREILAARPDDGVLGEEGAAREGTSGVRWVLDPLDGTVNYLYGLPVWAVSVGVQVDARTVVGVVGVPMAGVTYLAVLGRGALRRSDRPGRDVALSVNDPVPLDRALLATGFGYTKARRAAQGAALARIVPRIRDVRRGGSCAVDLCTVAEGRVDGYFEHGPQVWDHCAGALIAAEAGARFELVPVEDTTDPLIVAAGPALFDELRPLLRRCY